MKAAFAAHTKLTDWDLTDHFISGSLTVYIMRDNEVRDRVNAHVYNPGVGIHDLSKNQDPSNYDNLCVHLNA